MQKRTQETSYIIATLPITVTNYVKQLFKQQALLPFPLLEEFLH